MKKLLLLLAIACSVSAYDDFDYDDCEREDISFERNDNRYVKGFYGHGYSSQRHSHVDYITSYYGDQIEDYCDGLED